MPHAVSKETAKRHADKGIRIEIESSTPAYSLKTLCLFVELHDAKPDWRCGDLSGLNQAIANQIRRTLRLASGLRFRPSACRNHPRRHVFPARSVLS